MVCKVVLLFLFLAAVSSNPAADTTWRWIPRRATINPNTKNLPLHDFLKSLDVPSQRKPREPVTDLVRVANCGMAPLAPAAADSKIVGGTVAPPHKFPWQTAVFIDDLYFCGGSVISDEWVMTAGHCLHNAAAVTVVLGAHNISTAEPSQETYNSTDFFTHENFSMITAHYDIAMIHLPQTLVFNDYIQPVCLPAAPDLGADVIVTPSGWGLISDQETSIADEVHEVDVPTILNADCAAYYGDLFVTDAHICIDGIGGQGTCSGDSGGPLNYPNGGVTETRGITSYGSSEGCESGAPDAFTRVTHYLDWILTNTGVTRALPGDL